MILHNIVEKEAISHTYYSLKTQNLKLNLSRSLSLKTPSTCGCEWNFGFLIFNCWWYAFVNMWEGQKNHVSDCDQYAFLYSFLRSNYFKTKAHGENYFFTLTKRFVILSKPDCCGDDLNCYNSNMNYYNNYICRRNKWNCHNNISNLLTLCWRNVLLRQQRDCGIPWPLQRDIRADESWALSRPAPVLVLELCLPDANWYLSRLFRITIWHLRAALWSCLQAVLVAVFAYSPRRFSRLQTEGVRKASLKTVHAVLNVIVNLKVAFSTSLRSTFWSLRRGERRRSGALNPLPLSDAVRQQKRLF